MSNIFSKLKSFVLSNKIISAIIALVVVGFVARGAFSKPTSEENMFIAVTRGDIIQEVSVTGRLQPVSAVDLAFERGGKVGTIQANVGDTVKPGQVIVSIAAGDLAAQVRQAQAGVLVASAQLRQQEAALKSAELKLEQIKKGTRPEELQIAETAVTNAKQAVADAETNYLTVKAKAETDLANIMNDVPDVLSDAYRDADDAIRIKLATMFTYNSGTGYALTFNSCDFQAQSDVVNLRPVIEQELTDWQKELTILSSPPEGYDYEAEIKKTQTHLEDMKRFMERVNTLLNTPCLVNDSARATDRTNASLGRAAINASSVAINTQVQAIGSQKAINESALAGAQGRINDASNALKTAQDQLKLKQAGATPDDIAVQEAAVLSAQANRDAQRAQVLSAQANADNAAAQLEKSVIRSPIEGILTRQDAKIGEIVAASTPLVSVMSFSAFEIEANIPEVDIGSVSVGDPVRITIDAFPGDDFTGKVVEVDPAEQIVDGVVNFKVTVIFDFVDERFKSGLTANLEIETDRREDVLVLPQYAIAEKDEGNFVRVMDGGSQKEIPVQVGIRSKEGNVEIISGVSEGQEVLNVGFKEE